MDSRLELIEQTLASVLSETVAPPALAEAMRYAVGSGGKRLRPLVCLAAAEAVGGQAEDARYPAVAIELLHNYTLVHDDLPAMDNDRERRGRPTVWVQFGEANAILAGDALQALAFATAAKAPRNSGAIVAELGAGGVAVVAGQVEDLAGAAKDPSAVERVYAHKTAALFVSAAAMGALAAGAEPAAVQALKTFAHHLGLAFQYEDDLIDGDSPFDREETERRVEAHTAAALAALATLKGDTEFLRTLTTKLVGRSV